MLVTNDHAASDESRKALQQFNDEWQRFEAGNGTSDPASALLTPGDRQRTVLELIEVLEQTRQVVATLRGAGAGSSPGSASQSGLELLKVLVGTAGDCLVGAQQALQAVRQELDRLGP